MLHSNKIKILFVINGEIKPFLLEEKKVQGIFKRDKDTVDDKEYTYEHAGAEWSVRDVKALEELKEWMADEEETV